MSSGNNNVTFLFAAGGKAPVWFEKYKFHKCTYLRIRELGYLPHSIRKTESCEIYQSLKKKLYYFSSQCDLIHAHNISVGKNPLISLVLQELAAEGKPIVYHCHDFAEDMRALNQRLQKKIICQFFKKKLSDILYPQCENVSYVCINERARQFMIKAGAEPRRVYHAANPVYADLTVAGLKKNQKRLNSIRKSIFRECGLPACGRIFTYPSRAIRRKNIGEFILMANLFPADSWLITRAPSLSSGIEISPERKNYNSWAEFCKKNVPNIILEAGSKWELSLLYAASDGVISVSTSEGFGYALIEPWLYDLPVYARIPRGLFSELAQFPYTKWLYQRLDIPASLFVNTRKNKITSIVDFADLSAAMQKKIILLCKKNITISEKFREKLQFIPAGQGRGEERIRAQSEHVNKNISKIINKNADYVKTRYSLKVFTDTMIKIYSAVYSGAGKKTAFKKNKSLDLYSLVKSFFCADNMCLNKNRKETEFSKL